MTKLALLCALLCALLVGCIESKPPYAYPTDPTWCTRPVIVRISDALPTEDQEAAVRAVEWWNAQGVTYLRAVVSPAAYIYPLQVGIRVVPGELAPGKAGEAKHFRFEEGCLAAAEVVISAGQVQVAAHEIGHALGLHHVWDADNIMHPYVTFGSTGPWELSADQRDLLTP